MYSFKPLLDNKLLLFRYQVMINERQKACVLPFYGGSTSREITYLLGGNIQIVIFKTVCSKLFIESEIIFTEKIRVWYLIL